MSPPIGAGFVNELTNSLLSIRTASADQLRLRDDYLTLLRSRGGSALDRSSASEHITASTLVLSQDLNEVLLCFHRKGQFWVQPGGHVEASDVSLRAAACANLPKKRDSLTGPSSVTSLT